MYEVDYTGDFLCKLLCRCISQQNVGAFYHNFFLWLVTFEHIYQAVRQIVSVLLLNMEVLLNFFDVPVRNTEKCFPIYLFLLKKAVG